MRHLLEVCCPSSARPTAASSSLRRTSLPEDMSWWLPGGSSGMPRSPLWGSPLAPPLFPALYFPLSVPPALFSSSRVKSSSRRTTQERRSCLWNTSTCGNKLRTMYPPPPPPKRTLISASQPPELRPKNWSRERGTPLPNFRGLPSPSWLSGSQHRSHRPSPTPW